MTDKYCGVASEVFNDVVFNEQVFHAFTSLMTVYLNRPAIEVVGDVVARDMHVAIHTAPAMIDCMAACF